MVASTTDWDPFPDLRDPDRESDPHSEAIYIMADLLARIILDPAKSDSRRKDVLQAMKGDISGLYVWEQRVIRWLKIHGGPGVTMNAWTAQLLDNFHE